MRSIRQRKSCASGCVGINQPINVFLGHIWEIQCEEKKVKMWIIGQSLSRCQSDCTHLSSSVNQTHKHYKYHKYYKYYKYFSDIWSEWCPDKKTKDQKTNRQKNYKKGKKTKREFNVMSGQFCTLAMFFLSHF